MSDIFARTEMLLGPAALGKLAASKVAVFGIGGVGSFTVEGLARSGVGQLVLVDHDLITVTNINRQIHATHKTLGLSKVEVMRQRILDINPEAQVETRQEKYTPERGDSFFSLNIDYVVDAIDMVSAKIDLIVRARTLGVPIISSMGTGNKLDPSRLELADIYETEICPLARVLRRELKKRGVQKLQVVYSRESPALLQNGERAFTEVGNPGKHLPGSTAFVPPAAGLLIASWVVRDLLQRNIKRS